MSTTNLFVQNAATISQDLLESGSNGVNMPYDSQTIPDMNRTIFPMGAQIGQIDQIDQDVTGEETAIFGTHIREGIAIVKDWIGSSKHK